MLLCRCARILIDDRIDLKQDWEDAGGVFVHHVDAETTIQTLRSMGVLPPNSDGGDPDDGDIKKEPEVVCTGGVCMLRYMD